MHFSNRNVFIAANLPVAKAAGNHIKMWLGMKGEYSVGMVMGGEQRNN